jgi:hypothetical protein
LAFVAMMVRGPELVVDIVAETFARAYQGRGSFRDQVVLGLADRPRQDESAGHRGIESGRYRCEANAAATAAPTKCRSSTEAPKSSASG